MVLFQISTRRYEYFLWWAIGETLFGQEAIMPYYVWVKEKEKHVTFHMKHKQHLAKRTSGKGRQSHIKQTRFIAMNINYFLRFIFKVVISQDITYYIIKSRSAITATSKCKCLMNYMGSDMTFIIEGVNLKFVFLLGSALVLCNDFVSFSETWTPINTWGKINSL